MARTHTVEIQRDAIEALLLRSRRDHVPIRRSFVQLRERGGGAGALAWFIHERRTKTLDLYLLTVALASAPPYDVALASSVWARALGISDYKSASSTVSRSWTWLADHHLIHTGRRGRLREVRLLREDGSGDPYSHPSSEGDYFKLPYVYWRANLHNRLGLPAKSVLLIALSLRQPFKLPAEHAARWYGVSRDTIAKGLRDLRTLGIIDYRESVKPAPLTAAGITRERLYVLQRPFRTK